MRLSHNIGAEYTMVYSIRDVTRGVTPALGAVVYFKVFISMKMLIIFLMVILTFSSCVMERKTYIHYHPWNRMNHVHKYRVPQPYRKYVAPSRIYDKRGW